MLLFFASEQHDHLVIPRRFHEGGMVPVPLLKCTLILADYGISAALQGLDKMPLEEEDLRILQDTFSSAS